MINKILMTTECFKISYYVHFLHDIIRKGFIELPHQTFKHQNIANLNNLSIVKPRPKTQIPKAQHQPSQNQFQGDWG